MHSRMHSSLKFKQLQFQTDHLLLVMVGCRKWQRRWMSMLLQHRDVDAISMSTNSVIDRHISVKHLTPPPFAITILWGEDSSVAAGAEEVTADILSATPGRARQAWLPVGHRRTDDSWLRSAVCQWQWHHCWCVPQWGGALDRSIPRRLRSRRLRVVISLHYPHVHNLWGCKVPTHLALPGPSAAAACTACRSLWQCSWLRLS